MISQLNDAAKRVLVEDQSAFNDNLINREPFAKYARTPAKLMQPLGKVGWVDDNADRQFYSLWSIYATDAFMENGVKSSGS